MEESNKIKNDVFCNLFKIPPSIYLNDINIFFNFKNKKEIGSEDVNNEDEKNKKIKNLIQMLKVKINKFVFKIEMSNIGCGGEFSFICDNSFIFFSIF
jgi:hypothetical protein